MDIGNTIKENIKLIKEGLVREYQTVSICNNEVRNLRIGKHADGIWFDFICDGIHDEMMFSDNEVDEIISWLAKLKKVKCLKGDIS